MATHVAVRDAVARNALIQPYLDSKLLDYLLWLAPFRPQRAIAYLGAEAYSEAALALIRAGDLWQPELGEFFGYVTASIINNLKQAARRKAVQAERFKPLAKRGLTIPDRHAMASLSAKLGQELWSKYKNELKPRQQLVLKMRFGLDGFAVHTYKAGGEVLAISKNRFGQLVSRALQMLVGAVESLQEYDPCSDN